MVNTDIYKQAFDTMKGTGISSLGPSYAPTFTPNIVSNPWDVIDDVSQSYDVSFPTREMADRFDYGYGQMVGHMTNPDGSIDPWRYRDNDYHVNPDIFANIYGGGPDGPHNRGARLVAEQFNNPSITENFDYVGPQQDLLKMIAWNNAMNAGEIDVDEMYLDEGTMDTYSPDLYMTQEEQVKKLRESGDIYQALIADQMEKYGRGNPYVQNLSGTYDNFFGETFGMDEDQVGLRDVNRGYALAYADSPMTSPINQIYPDEQFLPSPYTPPSNRPPAGYDDLVNYTQTWQTIAERLGIEAANEWLAKEQSTDKAHLGNYDLYHLMGNGYTLEEAQQLLETQLG